PVPDVTSRLKCRGQVTASTKVVTYEVVVRERGYDPAPYAIVDALMYADGKPVVDITDMSVRLSGLTREKAAAVCRRPPTPPPPPAPTQGRGGEKDPPGGGVNAPLAGPPPLPFGGEGGRGGEGALYDRRHVLAFATGKPSEAFGDRYLPFDSDR